MSFDTQSLRYIYKTQGVCPPEIHFRIDGEMLSDIRFVGGGCPGNAQLVGRLLLGRPLDEVMRLSGGIACRNGTSCPDQLAAAIEAARSGRLAPAASFRLAEDPADRERAAVIGQLCGNPRVLGQVSQHAEDAGVHDIICLGNLTGASTHNTRTLKALRKTKAKAVQGCIDWHYANHCEQPDFPPIEQQDRDWLLQLPQVLSFRLGGRQCVAFSGDFVQTLPGYSDYDRFALEMNMVCGLTDFMTDETVFPALEAMLPQFDADVVVFSQGSAWGHWHIGGKDFIRVGPADEPDTGAWGLLAIVGGKLTLNVMPIRR